MTQQCKIKHTERQNCIRSDVLRPDPTRRRYQISGDTTLLGGNMGFTRTAHSAIKRPDFTRYDPDGTGRLYSTPIDNAAQGPTSRPYQTECQHYPAARSGYTARDST